MDYYTGFPTPEDSLGGTQLKFFTNWASVKTFVDTNHYDFANTLAGNHKWVLYGRQTGTFPDTSSPSALTIATYAAADSTPRTQLWFQPQNDATGANAIQLTAGDVTDAAFSTNAAYTTVPAQTNRLGGWTFLPGGLLMQYGSINIAVSAATTIYPVEFSGSPYSLQITPYFSGIAPSSKPEIIVSLSGSPTKTFTFAAGNSNATGYFWIAIGPA